MITKLVTLAKVARSLYKRMEENEGLIADLTTLRRTLRWHCMWPTESETKGNYGRFKLKIAVCMFFNGITLLGIVLHIRNVKLVDPTADLSEEWSAMLTLSATLLVWACFTPNVLNAVSHLKYLSKLHRQETPPHLRNAVHKFSILYSVIYLVMLGGVVLYILQQVVNKCVDKGRNGDRCGLIAPFWLPFEFDSVPVRLVISIIQFVAIFLCTTAVGLGSLYGFAATVHVVICLRHLDSMAKSVVTDGKVNRGRLRRVIQYHQHVIYLLDVINDVASVPLCMHLLLSSTLLGLLVHNLLVQNLRSVIGPFIHFAFYLTSFLLNCMGGQWVLDESTQLSTWIYADIKWYEMDTKERRDVLFIIIRCQKPLLLRAGSVGHLSLPVFTQVIKGIYYMSLLDILNIYK